MQFQNFAKMYGFETMSFWLVKYNAATLNRPQIILHLNQSKKSRRTWWNIFSAPYYIILITKRIFPTCLTWRSAAPSLLHLNNCLPLFGFFSLTPPHSGLSNLRKWDSGQNVGGGGYENSRFLKDFQREIFYFENHFIIHMCQKIFAPAARQEDMDFLRKNR